MGIDDVRKRLPVVDALPPSKGRRRLPFSPEHRELVQAVWELTLACDQRCRACGPRAGRARPDELTTEEALRLVDELAELGTGEVTLIGGEAYLRDDVLLVVRAIRNAGMKASMTTGARNLTRARVDALAEAGLEMVGVSIDGTQAEHDRLRGTPGGWQRCIDALGHLREAGIEISANTQINPVTMGTLERLGERLADEGITAWQLFLTIAHGNAADDPSLVLQPYMLLEVFEELRRVVALCERRRILFYPGNNLGYFGPYEHEIRHRQRGGYYNGCMAGRAGIGIEADGSIKSCPSLGGAAHTGGSWREHGLREIWERAPQILALSRRTVDDLWGYCRECYYADTCKAGCTATSEPLFGRPGNNPFCHHRAQQMDARGLRERIEPTAAAPDVPFGMGRFRLIVESTDPSERADAETLATKDTMI